MIVKNSFAGGRGWMCLGFVCCAFIVGFSLESLGGCLMRLFRFKIEDITGGREGGQRGQ